MSNCDRKRGLTTIIANLKQQKFKAEEASLRKGAHFGHVFKRNVETHVDNFKDSRRKEKLERWTRKNVETHVDNFKDSRRKEKLERWTRKNEEWIRRMKEELEKIRCPK
ncbi:hypothetical protein QE152_g4448 [Popillia japonica]|uniref:Uncharacterized protein n=1 Tax=Popillia japonica TaxID=7064 RepID=A0AAW1N0X8_POPJA